jgi:ribosomal protein L20A (L18A)
MGSVSVQLKWQDNSTVKKMTKEDEKIKEKDAVKNFYSLLSEKHSLSEEVKKEKCKKLQYLKGGESNW